ncbi:molybdopterin-dependent oxidoreductase [Paenibacillus roseipurpureus]|uniref:Molybdopterin-dependent oxidoreductase n=1 Tax=Paenibacillus roseopurpureus TaxID=2918901 RepID=A0AA96RLN6_9BACL|nr:molybdopterin-dependent oxidoreductase [Paenibacillus sp. MBLB1832]WNR43387.1 molybdopterin-dependent oxidoreductase [Paenibacillus sp. MBLB1832]
MHAPISIQVTELHIENETYTVEQMVEAAKQQFRVEDRVPSVQGDAFDLKDWHRNWRISHSMEGIAEPTHVQVEAIDEFQARMPWSQVDQALFLYAQEGQPLKKGYPIRLYVPDGSSECLNVKSIVKIWFLHDASLGEEATYGFKNKVTLDEMKLKK